MIGKEGWPIQMYQIGVEIGGTFTDCVLIGTDGRGTEAYASAKALSTKDDRVDGVMASLEKLAANVGLSVGQLLARTSRFGHGTTIGASDCGMLECGEASAGPGRCQTARWNNGPKAFLAGGTTSFVQRYGLRKSFL
jgi:Hydantoinase/oxoprolinase N-terminal region